MARRLHQACKLPLRGLREVRQRRCNVALRVHLENDAAFLARSESAVHPARQIKITARVHVHIRRPEGVVANLLRFQLGFEHREIHRRRRLEIRRAALLQRVRGDGLPAPVHGQWTVIPRVRPARFGDPRRTAARAAAVIRQRPHRLLRKVFVEAGIAVVFQAAEMMEARVPAAAVVGVVPGKAVEQWADGGLQDVARPGAVEFKTGSVLADAHHAAAAQLERASIGALRLGETKVANGGVEPAINSDLEAVGGVVRAAL